MRVLFLESEPMWVNGLPNGFKDAGHEVYISGCLTGHNIPVMISKYKPDMIVSMGWTSENTGYKVEWIRKYVKQSNIPYIYWATEDPTHTLSFTLPLIQKIMPDFIFTICKERVDFYKKLGYKAEHIDFGFHKSVHYSGKPLGKYRCGVAVVANGYDRILKIYPNHYRIKSIQTLITPLIKENIRVDFWGWGWDKMNPIIGHDIPGEYIHGKLPYIEANKVYNSADIVLGLQNQTNQLSQRTYEILASGGVLLTSDTPEVRRLFKPGLDLLVSSSPAETLEQVRCCLGNKEKLEVIRKRALAAVVEHSYDKRAEYMVNVLYKQKILHANK